MPFTGTLDEVAAIARMRSIEFGSTHRTWSTEVLSESIVRDLLTVFIGAAQLAENEQVVCSMGSWCGGPGSGYECDGCVRETRILGRLRHATDTSDL